MDTSKLLAFIGISALLAVTPGPDMAMVTKNALRGGRPAALFTTVGIATALMIHTTAAALGLALLLRSEVVLFTAVRICGAVYLAYLGIQSIIASTRVEHESDAAKRGPGPTATVSNATSYRQGFLSALLNPKLLVFFATFLSQFVDPAHPIFPQMLALGLIFDAIGLAWLTCYGLLVSKMGDFFRSPRIRKVTERITGVVLIGFAGRLALEH